MSTSCRPCLHTHRQQQHPPLQPQASSALPVSTWTHHCVQPPGQLQMLPPTLLSALLQLLLWLLLAQRHQRGLCRSRQTTCAFWRQRVCC
jgi:hypothetical protein